MRFGLRLLPLALTIALGVGCGDAITQPPMPTPIPTPIPQTSTPTPNPQRQTPTPVPRTPVPSPVPSTPTPNVTPILPGLHLSGIWTGQVSLWGQWIHGCTAVEDIRVKVNHVEEHVSLHIPTSCLGNLWLQGTLARNSVTFDVWTPGEEKYTHITGPVTRTSIRAANRSSNFGMSLTLSR